MDTKPETIHKTPDFALYGHFKFFYQIPVDKYPAPSDMVTSTPTILHREVLAWSYRQVVDYSRRLLTKSSDCFPAISGLAMQHADRTAYHYKSGIRLEDFERGLIWWSYGGNIDCTFSPTWSWATIQWIGAVYSNSDMYEIGYWTHLPGPKTIWVGDSFVLTGGGIFGQVESGEISLQGPSISLSTLWECPALWLQKVQTLHGLDYAGLDRNVEPDQVCLMMNIEGEPLKHPWLRGDLLVLRLVRFGNISGYNPSKYIPGTPYLDVEIEAAFGLILQPSDASPTNYRRIEIIGMPLKISDDPGCEVKTITII